MAIEKFKGKNGDYYFRVISSNGRIILQSEGYKNLSGVKNGISSVIENAKPESFEIKKSRSGDTYFVLKAGNGKIIGKSEMYKSEEGAKRGIKAVIQNTQEIFNVVSN